jgi:hypothetical protein
MKPADEPRLTEFLDDLSKHVKDLRDLDPVTRCQAKKGKRFFDALLELPDQGDLNRDLARIAWTLWEHHKVRMLATTELARSTATAPTPERPGQRPKGE